jgi:hypothetical protein
MEIRDDLTIPEWIGDANRAYRRDRPESGRKNLAAVAWEEAQVPPAVPEPKPLRNGLLTLVGVWALYAGFTLAMFVVLRR